MLPPENIENKNKKSGSQIDFLQDWEKELAEERNKIYDDRKNLKMLEAKVKFRENLLVKRERQLEKIVVDQAEREEKLRLSEETAEEISKFAAMLDAQNEEVQKQKNFLKNLQEELTKREQEIQTKITDQETVQVEKLQKKLKTIRDQEIRSLNIELERMRKDMTREVDRRRQSLENETTQRLFALDEELKKRREKFNANLNQLRAQTDEELKNLREEFNQSIAKRRENFEEELKKQRELSTEKISVLREQHEEFFQEQKSSLQKKEESLRDLQAQLNVDKKNLEVEKLRLKTMERKIKNLQTTFDQEIERRFEARKKTLDEKILAMNHENEMLRSELKIAEEKLASFETLRAIYGDNPEILRQRLLDLQKAYESLQEEFSKRPGSEILQQHENLKAENSRLKVAIDQQLEQLGILKRQASEVEELRITNTILQESYDALHAKWTEAQDLIKHLQKS